MQHISTDQNPFKSEKLNFKLFASLVSFQCVGGRIVP